MPQAAIGCRNVQNGNASIDLNWLLLISAEGLAWVFTAVFIVIRYWLEWRRASVLVLAVVVLDKLFIFGLGLVDWIRTGAVSAYQIVIGALVITRSPSGTVT